MSSKSVAKWSDEFMFTSEKHTASEGPKVHLLSMSHDPLGQIAAAAKMYKGEVVRDLSKVTDDERRYYLGEIQKTKLAMPLETVSMHFMIENVTRAFTHQLVRQRTAAYAQESMRFAVVEDMTEAVALPPSLAGTLPIDEWLASSGSSLRVDPQLGESRERNIDKVTAYVERYASDEQKARFKWDETVRTIGSNYMDMVNNGMPAEDARGLMPTNIVTRINYITNFRGLLDHAGNRLCTQAQFEWRMVFAEIVKAIGQYPYSGEGAWHVPGANAWQFAALAQTLRPVCYQTGKCAFKADFDRKCSIRERVDANAKIGRPSSEWDKPHHDKVTGLEIGSIKPSEWLTDPAAAR